MYVANVAEHGFHDNPLLAAVEAHAAKEGAPVVPVCAALESEIADLDGDDKQAFLADLGLTEPGLDRVIHAGYKLLGLQTYFTAGPKEVRAWTIHVGDTAPQAAGVIHTDFEKGFIRAEVIAYADFVAYKGEQGAKEAGKMRLEGKEYVVQGRRRHAFPLQCLTGSVAHAASRGLRDLGAVVAACASVRVAARRAGGSNSRAFASIACSTVRSVRFGARPLASQNPNARRRSPWMRSTLRCDVEGQPVARDVACIAR